MRLPGGVWSEGQLRRDFRFRPLQGHVELAISENNAECESTPARVTAILTAALEQIGGIPVSEEAVWDLAVGDRQFLMRQLALRLGKDDKWFSADCHACEETFDFSIQQSRLPMKEAGEGFPYAKASGPWGELCLRVPSGREQMQLPQDMGVEEARLWLLQRCVERGDGDSKTVSLDSLTDEDILELEQALEDIAPEIGTLVEVECPVCGASNRVYLDPYAPVFEMKSELFAQIHTLAATYHWSQGEILDLPIQRRMTYLGLIDRARGMVE